MSNEEQQALKDLDYWRAIAAMIGPGVSLIGFSYRDSASFTNPYVEIPGIVAKALSRQANQLAAQRAIVAADDELHRRLAVDIGTVGPSVRSAWDQACDAREEAKRIDGEATK